MNDTQWFANKAKMINHVLISNLDAKAKVLVVELIMRRNPQTGQLDPGVARLCMARGIKDTKNWKGLDTYLPGLVTVHRTPGKKNSYSLNDEAIMALPEAEVKLSGNNYSNHPSTAGYRVPTPLDHPASEANPPSVEGYYPPSVEGSNSKVESKVYSSLYNREMSVMSSSPEENQGEALVEINIPGLPNGLSSGDTKREVLEEIGFSPLVDEVTANAAPSTIASGETKTPGYSSVTSKTIANVTVDNEMVTKTLEERRIKKEMKKAAAPGYRKDRVATSQKALEAPQSVVDASGAGEGQTVPEKPQKPVYEVPSRNPYHSDSDHERRVHNAEVAFTKAMGKWRQDVQVWESKYGDSPSTESETTNSSTTPTLSPQSSERLAKYSALRVQAHAY